MGSLATRFIFFESIGSFKLSVPGMMLLFKDNKVKMASTLPAAPNKCPIEDLV